MILQTSKEHNRHQISIDSNLSIVSLSDAIFLVIGKLDLSFVNGQYAIIEWKVKMVKGKGNPYDRIMNSCIRICLKQSVIYLYYEMSWIKIRELLFHWEMLSENGGNTYQLKSNQPINTWNWYWLNKFWCFI